jgi:hypothetical protein
MKRKPKKRITLELLERVVNNNAESWRGLKNEVEVLQAQMHRMIADKVKPKTKVPIATAEIAEHVCAKNGHVIGIISQNVVQLPSAMHKAPEFGQVNTSMCLKCGMTLAEIRGEKK